MFYCGLLNRKFCHKLDNANIKKFNFCRYFSYTGWAKKKNSYKTEIFLLLGKIVKKKIITGISIINSITRNKKPFYGELMLFFFKKLENKSKDLISICSNVDVSGCFDFFLSCFISLFTQNVFVLKTRTDSIKNLKLYKKRIKVLINLNHKSF